MTLDEGLHLSLTVTAKDEQAAGPMAKSLSDGVAQARGMIHAVSRQRSELAPLLSLVDGIKVTTAGDSVSVTGDFKPGAMNDSTQKPDRPRPPSKRPRGGR